LAELQTITVHKLKQIFDDFNQFSSLIESIGHLINILDILQNINVIILTDPLIINHKFYSLLIDLLEHICNKWHKSYYLPEMESFIFCHIIEILFKIEIHPEKLIPPIKTCLKDIAKHGKHLYDKNNMKYFSKLVSLYTQNQKIINAIVKCWCSKYYVKIIERIENEEFLLITCPKYWIAYSGSDKEETANILLNALLPSSNRLLQLKPSKHVTHLLDLLNHSFALCSSTIFTNNSLLVPITYTLLAMISKQSIFEEIYSMIKSILRLLLTLINNNQMIFQCVQQHQELFQNLIGLEDEAYIILVSIMNDSDIKSMINSNETFALCVQKHIEQQNDTNHFLTARLK
ncbi:unnamed protein product, partial [Rotaria sp. Silwood2]